MPLVKSLKRFFASSSCGCNARKNKRSNNKRSNSNKRVRRSRKNRRRTLKGGYIHSGSTRRTHKKTPSN